MIDARHLISHLHAATSTESQHSDASLLIQVAFSDIPLHLFLSLGNLVRPPWSAAIMQGPSCDNMVKPSGAPSLQPHRSNDQLQHQHQHQLQPSSPHFAQNIPRSDLQNQSTSQQTQFHPQVHSYLQSPVTPQQHSFSRDPPPFTFQSPPFSSPAVSAVQPSQSSFSPSSQPASMTSRVPTMQPSHMLSQPATGLAGPSSHHFPASTSSLPQPSLSSTSNDHVVDSKRTYLTTGNPFEDPIAQAYIAGQNLDEPFYSVAPPKSLWPSDSSMPLDLNLMPPLPTEPNDPSLGFSTDQPDFFDPFASSTHALDGSHTHSLDSAAAILDDADFSRFTEVKMEADGDDSTLTHHAAGSSSARASKDNSTGLAASCSTAAAASKDGIPPRRRTRRRQNISCDQCRASKRGCDFQLRLDADGNDILQATTAAANDDEQVTAGNTGDKRKISDAGLVEGGNASGTGTGTGKLICSNCQRRGIECTTNFADSVRESKQATQTNKEELNTQTTKKRVLADNSSESGRRSISVSSDGTSPGGQSQEAREQLLKACQNRNESQMLSTTGANVRFAQRADSLLLTTNRMRLYVHTVEPNANLWLSRACSPLRTDSDLSAYIKRTIGLDALSLSQRLWASWHVDAPSTQKEHQPNLFYLVYGIDHLGGEMGVWGEKPQHDPSASVSQPRNHGSAQEASAQFNDIFSDIMGMSPGGWRRSKRDLMIDEAVKAAMLAYACQFRLDDELTSSSADAVSRQAADGKNYRDAHDRIATAAWKRARSLILQLAPRRSCRIAYGLFLFGVTAPPPGALAEGGSRSGADAVEDAAFALETASRHLEWFVKRCRDLVLTVEKASKNPLLSANPQFDQHRRIATDLMGLAESLGWFGLLIDTVTHVSQGRRSSMREDNLVYQSSGMGSGTDSGIQHGRGQSPGSDSSTLDRTAEALFAMQDALNLLPSRQAPPGAFPGTSESYMHEDPEDDGTFPVDTEMSRRIMERAACARDLIPALLRNPGALANAIPFDVLIGANDPDGPPAPGGGPIINIHNPGGGLNEQVVLLGVAWGTAVEVYIWRRVGVLHTASEALLGMNDPVQALIAGGGNIVSERIEKMAMNVIEAIRLFHNIFDHLIARAMDEFIHLSRQARTMLSFFVIHIHLGVLHFTQLAKKIEQKELELIQAFNAANGGVGSPAKSTSSSNGGVNISFSPMAVSSPTQTQPAGKGTSPSNSEESSYNSPASILAMQNVPHQQLRSLMLHSSVERRLIGRSAALGMARMASLINAESAKLEETAKLGRNSAKAQPKDGKVRKGSFYASPQAVKDFTPIEDSANAPWRHPYPAMVADVLKLSSQQLHDEIWDQLIAVPRNEAELDLLMRNFNVLLEGFRRLLHAVPGLGSYKGELESLENARDTAQFVASQGHVGL